MVREDSILAQRIVSNSFNNYSNNLFNNHSQIYIKSNERINYLNKYYKDKNNALSVISSSDQIINMINNNIYNIDAFDISVFPKYYLFLKLNALKILNKKDYLDMFYKVDNTSEYYDDLYFDLIRKELDGKSKEFWDSLINFFDWNEIISSPLFSSETVSITDVLNQNDYLKDINYITLKDKINKTNIKTYDGNIINLINKFKHNTYDLAYLSNIIYYIPIHKYKYILNNINLSDNGIALSYLYDSINQIYNYMNSNKYQKDIIENNCGILVKRK